MKNKTNKVSNYFITKDAIIPFSNVLYVELEEVSEGSNAEKFIKSIGSRLKDKMVTKISICLGNKSYVDIEEECEEFIESYLSWLDNQ